MLTRGSSRGEAVVDIAGGIPSAARCVIWPEPSSVSGGPGSLGWVQMVELLSVLTWLGFLTVLVIFQARSQRASARRLTIVAFLVAVIAAISFVFWPMAPSYSTTT